MTRHKDRNDSEKNPDSSSSGFSRRSFLKYSLVVIPAATALHSGKLFAASVKSHPTYPIAPEVFTTLQQRIVPGPKPATGLPLSEVSKFVQYGYGSWTPGAPLVPSCVQT